MGESKDVLGIILLNCYSFFEEFENKMLFLMLLYIYVKL